MNTDSVEQDTAPPPGEDRRPALSPVEALDELVVDNPDLERLEALLDRFNLFEAIGVVRQELRHSDFLAYMLDPARPHGLGDAVLKRLLTRVLLDTPACARPLSLIDVDVWDLGQTMVSRETSNIDLLLECEPHKLAIVFENKIDTTEHDGQLQRYHQQVTAARRGWNVVGIYLTPDGDKPTDDRYLAASYGQIAEAIDHVVDRRASTIGQDVRLVASHYSDMLRRYIVGGSEVDELCNRIYRKHQRALDMIFERRPDQQEVLRHYLIELIRRRDDLTLDHTTKSAIRFLPTSWDVPYLSQGVGWTPTGRMLLFEFGNNPKYISLYLYLGPGPESVRQTVFDLACDNRPAFKPSGKGLYSKWNCLWMFKILVEKDLQDDNLGELTSIVEHKWDRFLKDDLPAINEALLAQPWMAQATGGTDPVQG